MPGDRKTGDISGYESSLEACDDFEFRIKWYLHSIPISESSQVLNFLLPMAVSNCDK